MDVQRQGSTNQALQHIDEVVDVPVPTTDDLCLNETADEDGLEHEKKKRKLPTPADAVSESRADEAEFDRFDDLPLPEGKTLFKNIASDDEAKDDPEQDQEMTRSLVQGGRVDGGDGRD